MKAYKIICKPTGVLGTTTYGPGKWNFDEDGKDPFRDCVDGVIYVITDEPKKIYDEFPLAMSVKEIGHGYCL